MKKYNKSEIMKSAWNYYRTGHYASFSTALKQAWFTAKYEMEQRLQGYVPANELNTGDTIEILYGHEENLSTCTVTTVSTISLFGKDYLIINAISVHDSHLEVEFCPEPNDMIKRIAKADQMQAAA